MKKTLYCMVGIMVFIITIVSLLGYSKTLEVNQRVTEYKDNGNKQMQMFSNQEDLLTKNANTIKKAYINHWLQHCGQTSYNGSLNRHLFCAHWYNGSGRKEEKYEILDVLDIGYYGGNGNVELKSPTYIYSYASNREIHDTSSVSVFLAQQAYRSAVELSVEIDDVMPNIVPNLDSVLSPEVYNKLKSAAYKGSTSMGKDFTNKKSNVWVIHDENANSTGEYYTDSTYDDTRNIGEFCELKTLDDNGEYTSTEGSVNLESDNIVGPFYLKIPNDVEVTVDTDLPYTIDGDNIESEKGFYIKFQDTIPDEISFSCTYNQYYGRIFITYGGKSQDVWISTGDKAPHTSTVTYTIIKGADLSANTYVQYSRYRNEELGLNSTQPNLPSDQVIRKAYTEDEKENNPFYAEQGDILKVGIEVKNNTSTNANVSQINSSYEDVVSLSTSEELNEKWNSEVMTQLDNSAWIEVDSLNSYATTYCDDSQYLELNQKQLAQNSTVVENLMLTVNANQKTYTDIYEINGNILSEDISPEDLDETNNSSSDYIKLKSIDAKISKEIMEETSDGDRDEKGKYVVEYGDHIEYLITVSNPIPEGQSSNSVSTIYNTKFVENIPEGLEIQDIQKFANGNWISVLNNANVQQVNNTFEITIDNSYGISPNNAAAYIFKYQVTSCGVDSSSEEEYQKITNTAKLVEYYNRNNYQYTDSDSSSEDIYVKSYELNINKFLYMYSDVNTIMESGYPECEGRNLLSEDEKRSNPMYVEYGDRLLYQIDIANNGQCTLNNIKIEDIFDNQELELELSRYTLIEMVENDNIVKEISSDNSLATYTILELEPGESETIRIVFNIIKTFSPEEAELDTQIINTAKIVSVKNHNNIELIEQDTQENKVNGPLESSEYCIEKLYNVKTNKYISGYVSEMMNENIENGLVDRAEEMTTYYEGHLEQFGENRKNLSTEEKELKPFSVEKTDIVTYTIKIENELNEVEANDATVKVGTILDYLDDGLTVVDDSFEAILIQNGERIDLQRNLDYSVSGIDKYTDSFAITFPEKIELKPSEYIEFKYNVEIITSNMQLQLLKNEAILTEIVNRNDLIIIDQMIPGTPTEDTGLNPPSTSSTEYVKLKDIVVSGHIWNDLNENGLKEEEEPGIPNVEVELNGLTDISKANLHTKVYTDENGLYTFGRVFKANQNEEYENTLYISYQYDGIKYQSTIYSGKENLVYADNAYHMKPNYKIDSNAKEIDLDRIEFNNSLKTIYYNKGSQDFEPTINDITLNYNKTDSISTKIDNQTEENTTKIKSYSFLIYEEQEEAVECLWFENPNDREYDTEYLKYINLGLVSRDVLDLSITEKLDSVTNTVFGDTLGYTYSEDEEAEFEYYPEDYYYKYTDYKKQEIQDYLTDESELTTEVTYKVKITNGKINEQNELETIQDENVIVQVNEFAIYLDNKFTVEIDEDSGTVNTIHMKKLASDDLFFDDSISTVKAYMINEIEEKIELDIYNSSIYNPLESQMDIEEKAYIPLYVRPKEDEKIIISNSSLDNQEPGFTEIYLTFVDCNRSSTYEELITLNDKYNHVLEITSYSTYYEEDESYFKDNETYEDWLEISDNGAGYIDIDSNPGNIGLTNHEEYINFFDENIENYKLYDEDDTCRGDIVFEVNLSEEPDEPNDPDNPNGPGIPDTPDDPDNPEEPREPNLQRKISGIVFEDIRSIEVKDKNGENIQYIGNGLYNIDDTLLQNAKSNNNAKTYTDTPVKDVTVKLYKSIKIPDNNDNKYYEIDMSNEEFYVPPTEIIANCIDLTSEDGSYELNSFTPGTYFTRFEYGNNYENNMLIYNGQDYKSTTLADLDGEEDTYYNLEKMLKQFDLENSDEEINSTDSNILWTIRVLKQWISKYYEYPVYKEWYESMIEDYKTYSGLEQGFVNGFSMLGSYYSNLYGLEYQENETYQLLTIIGTDVLNNRYSYPEFDIIEVLYNNFEYSEIVKIYRNAITNYIENTIGSNAIDDPLRRLETIQYSQVQDDGTQEINNLKAEILSSPYKLVQLKNDDTLTANERNTKIKSYEALANIMMANTSMFADSIQFYVRAEDIQYDFDTETQYVANKIRPEIIYSLDNLGFGLQYRPENELTLREYIKELRVELSNGDKPIIQLFFNEDKSLNENETNIGLENVQSLDSMYQLQGEGKYTYQKGFKFINLDEQLLQGAMIYITYGIYIDNTGEIDRVSSELYEQGDTKSEYEGKINNAIEYYSNYYSEDYNYLTKPKEYLNYYKKYLGNTYYTGRVESADGINDVVTEVKINEVVNDMDIEILFDKSAYNQEWESIDDIQDLIDSGAYLFPEEYNMSNTRLSEEEKNTFMSNFIMTVTTKYLKLYNDFEKTYREEAFYEWYKAMINEFKTYSYLEQGIGNSFGMSFTNYVIDKYKGDYQDKLLYKFIQQIGEDAFVDRKTFEDEFDYGEIESVIEDSENEISEAIQELATEINSDKTSIVTIAENGDIGVMKKVKSITIEEPLANSLYNTTYKFISPENSSNSEKRATLEIITQREITSDILEHAELSFDNASEIINYTSISGRRTNFATTVGNGISDEIDSDESIEKVTFSKPTGLSIKEQKLYTTKTVMIWVIVIGIAVLVISFIVYKVRKRNTKVTFIK